MISVAAFINSVFYVMCVKHIHLSIFFFLLNLFHILHPVVDIIKYVIWMIFVADQFVSSVLLQQWLDDRNDILWKSPYKVLFQRFSNVHFWGPEVTWSNSYNISYKCTFVMLFAKLVVCCSDHVAITRSSAAVWQRLATVLFCLAPLYVVPMMPTAVQRAILPAYTAIFIALQTTACLLIRTYVISVSSCCCDWRLLGFGYWAANVKKVN